MDETYRQALNDKRWQVRTFASPLLLRVVLNENLVDILANEQKRLLLKVSWFVDTIGFHALQRFLTLFVNLLSRLLRRQHAPHLVKRIHVKRQVILSSLVVCDWRVRVAVELHDAIDELPYLFIIGMENVCTVLMHVDPLHILAVDITTEMRTYVNHQAAFTLFLCLVCVCGAVDAGTYNQQVVFLLSIHSV